MENKEVVKVEVEDKVINVVDFKDVRSKKGEPMDLEAYLKRPDTTVKRGEFIEILTQVLGNIDRELLDSFERVVRTANLMEIVVKALETKGVITMADISEAQKAYLDEYEKKQKEGQEDGQK
jgi:hypothetical protein